MRRAFHVLLLAAAMFALSPPLMGQRPGLLDAGAPPARDREPGGGNISETNRISGLLLQEKVPRRWDIAGKVVTLRGDPVPGAKVQAETQMSSKRQTLTTNSDGDFHTFFQREMKVTGQLDVRLTVRKKGFLPAQRLVEYNASALATAVRITLRPAQQENDTLSQEELISNLGPRLRELGRADGLSARAEKDYAQGEADLFTRDDPDQAIGSFKNVVRLDSSCAKCWTMLALAELESGDWDGAVRDAHVAAARTKSDPKTGSPEAFLLLGVMESWKDNPSGAAEYLAREIASAPGDALALQEMGRAQLQNLDWAGADTNLSKAIAAGAGSEARLLRVRALLGEYKTDEAKAEMDRYLGGRDLKEMPLRVHMVWDAIQDQKRLKETYAGKSGGRKGGTESVNYLAGDVPELKGLEPADSQDPLTAVLEKVGKNVAEFFQDFQNTSSMEVVHEEKGSQRGKVKGRLEQEFRYLCLLSDGNKPGFFNEYREKLSVSQGETYALKQGFMLTAGFVSASLNFHPEFQSQSTFRYIGRQKVDGREAYVIAFAQQPMKTKLSGSFTDGRMTATTYTQGLAWIDARNYQIVRLRTDLLKPLPEVKLDRQTTEIDYQEVHFKNSSVGFWLPREVAVTVDWNGKTLHNEHRYSNFQLFDVKTNQRIEQPKVAGQGTTMN
jgi:tetratricopeptide (TPR) repeat protein